MKIASHRYLAQSLQSFQTVCLACVTLSNLSVFQGFVIMQTQFASILQSYAIRCLVFKSAYYNQNAYKFN